MNVLLYQMGRSTSVTYCPHSFILKSNAVTNFTAHLTQEDTNPKLLREKYKQADVIMILPGVWDGPGILYSAYQTSQERAILDRPHDRTLMIEYMQFERIARQANKDRKKLIFIGDSLLLNAAQNNIYTAELLHSQWKRNATAIMPKVGAKEATFIERPYIIGMYLPKKMKVHLWKEVPDVNIYLKPLDKYTKQLQSFKEAIIIENMAKNTIYIKQLPLKSPIMGSGKYVYDILPEMEEEITNVLNKFITNVH